MALLFAPPFYRATDLSNAPIPGAFLSFYQTSTSTPQPIYADVALTIALSNPLQADGNGLYPAIWLDDSLPSYKWSLKYPDVNDPTIPGDTFRTGDPYNAATSAATLGAALYPISDAEQSAGLTTANLNQAYPVGDVRRYKPTLDGSTDDTVPLTNWAKVGGRLTFPVAKTAVITAPIPFFSNTQVQGCKGSIIATATHDINMFSANGQTDIGIRGLHFLQVSIGGGVNIGGVSLVSCSNCTVEDNEFEGMQFSGVFGSAITGCTIQNNYCHDALGTVQSSADIYVESSATVTSSYNLIQGNRCYGPNLEFGIAVWDPYSGVLPIHNKIAYNFVKAHNGYGILIYMPDAGDSYNQIIGNHVQDISAHSTNTSSGAGIYVVGAGAGGTQVIGNTVRNCCLATSVASLAPAGIGISLTSAGTVPVLVEGNTIEGMTQYFGIIMTGISGGASVIGNTIRMPAANSTGDGLRVTNSTNVTVEGNTINLLTTTTTQVGISLYANGTSNTNVTVANNTVTGGHSSQIRTLQFGTNFNTGIVITGNHLTGGDASCTPIVLDSASAQNVLVANNNVRATTNPAITQAACTNIRYSCNFLNTTGTIVVSFSGVNTGSAFDKSNIGQGAGAGVVNSGTGLVLETYGTASPAAGTWSRGDRVWNSAPSAAGVNVWVCTTAGTGGGTATFNTISNT